MIKAITAANVNGALLDALWWLKVAGIYGTSRNGDVLCAPMPVATTYQRPQERVLFSALRDANPFFHLMESIWMLAGANDVAFPARYAKQIAEYSDDGVVLNGAYGHRWRKHFCVDQLVSIIDELRTNPTTRRCVLAMWDGEHDFVSAVAGSKDVPCNTHAYFSTQRGVLDMTVCCRSNDAIWGCYGANAVHFSVLLEFVASAAGLPLGAYTQFSNNLHVYTERKDVERLLRPSNVVNVACDTQLDVMYIPEDLYRFGTVVPTPLLAQGEHYSDFLYDAAKFVEAPDDDYAYATHFFANVIVPMQTAHTAYKLGEMAAAFEAVECVAAEDWRAAAREWLERRL